MYLNHASLYNITTFLPGLNTFLTHTANCILSYFMLNYQRYTTVGTFCVSFITKEAGK